MDLDHIWNSFLEAIRQTPFVHSAEKKLITGLPFLYIRTDGTADRTKIEEELKNRSMQAMKGSRLNAELSYVRTDSDLYVFRFRFLVPQMKMFCCGNLCEDCIRYH
ncbi:MULTISPECIES: hypothetical protein [Fictibacillus]|uniref:Uncharacterized protein n=1 Tax=Fictibacillus terranigra TaxID=3058424 RepID=A0ABT8E6N6_9BACL|nr:hypothetical protein [Fictibacillus sp. CENA-BCM004]MDN4073563.1 hypothetical protein [Fictibacillus sp. CENA-BCM004]